MTNAVEALRVFELDDEAAASAYRNLAVELSQGGSVKPARIRAVLYRAGRTPAQLQQDLQRLHRRMEAGARLESLAPKRRELLALQVAERQAWDEIETAVREARRMIDGAKQVHGSAEAAVRAAEYSIARIEETARAALLETADLGLPEKARRLRELAQDLQERAEEYQIKANRLRAGRSEEVGRGPAEPPAHGDAEAEQDAGDLDLDAVRLRSEAEAAMNEAAHLESLPFDPAAGMRWEGSATVDGTAAEITGVK